MRMTACLLASVLLAACFETAPRAGDAWDVPLDPSTDDAPDLPTDVPVDGEVPVGACPWGWDCRVTSFPHFTGVDLLVVMDNSFDMGTYQATFIDQFPLLLSAFLDPDIDTDTGMPSHTPVTDVHLGVISIDMGTGGWEVTSCEGPVEGDDGLLLHEPHGDGCMPSYPLFLFYDEHAPDPAEIGDLADDFACIGALGTDGCGFEHPLEASLKALTTHSALGQSNDGFLRDDSVLLVVYLSTENDCSVSDPDLFDLENPEYGPASLRCYQNPTMLHPVARYIDGLDGLAASRPVLLGMIVGVPPDDARCNATGNYLGACNDVAEMTERTYPTDPSRLMPVCTAPAGDAFPGRRFVELAQTFGPRSYVHSICSDDFSPAFEAFAHMVHGLADASCSGTHVALTKDPSDRCKCNTQCRVVHVLSDRSSCPFRTIEWDSDGDTIPNQVRDGAGALVSACEVPHAVNLLSECWDECHDPYQVHTPMGTGWYYSLSGSGVACPTISFTDGFEPPPGAMTLVLCP
ncbi:MAG: hypothetical protein JRG91_18405 [Deltaproteobacteria bacterium]|nr:hypothetical protein [Deltaproteobacteria bacterium]